jgi:hypothetical protein
VTQRKPVQHIGKTVEQLWSYEPSRIPAVQRAYAKRLDKLVDQNPRRWMDRKDAELLELVQPHLGLMVRVLSEAPPTSVKKVEIERRRLVRELNATLRAKGISYTQLVAMNHMFGVVVSGGRRAVRRLGYNRLDIPRTDTGIGNYQFPIASATLKSVDIRIFNDMWPVLARVIETPRQVKNADGTYYPPIGYRIHDDAHHRRDDDALLAQLGVSGSQSPEFIALRAKRKRVERERRLLLHDFRREQRKLSPLNARAAEVYFFFQTHEGDMVFIRPRRKIREALGGNRSDIGEALREDPTYRRLARSLSKKGLERKAGQIERWFVKHVLKET